MTFTGQGLPAKAKAFIKINLISLVFIVASSLLYISGTESTLTGVNSQIDDRDSLFYIEQDKFMTRKAKKSGLPPLSSERIFFFDRSLFDRRQTPGKGFFKCRNLHPIRQVTESQLWKGAASIVDILRALPIQKMNRIRNLYSTKAIL